MSIISVIIILAIIGALLWLVTTYIPMNPTIKKIICVVVIIFVVLWLMSITGLLGHASDAKVPRL